MVGRRSLHHPGNCTAGNGRYGRVPRAHVRLIRDRAVSLPLQDRPLAATPVERVESIDASHSAHFSRPDELVATILRLDGP